MRRHLRLRQSDRKLLEEHVERVQSKGCRILVAGYEDWDIKTQSASPLHVHILIEATECDQTTRDRVKGLGYKTGVNYYLKTIDDHEDSFRYCCKGSKCGVYDVGYLDEGKAFEYHHEYWKTHDEIERRKDKKADRTPLYFQIASHIQANRESFSRTVMVCPDREFSDKEVAAEDYDEERDGAFEYTKDYLDTDKAIEFIVGQYAQFGPLFDGETVKKCLYMVAARVDRESLVKKLKREIGTIKAEW